MRKLGVAAVVLCGVLGAGGEPTSRADGDAGAAAATMTCDHAEAPGRVRCEVEARVAAGRTIGWGDVVIVQTPPFATALRGRIGPHDATVRDPDVWRWALAVVARERGGGDLLARVRLVVCKEGKCRPETIDVKGRLGVGE